MTNEIAKGVFYVGVNDRTSDLFERLWPLPLGITYNSYLIKDKSNVLIDTVEHTHNELFFEQIKEVIGDEPIEYLVVNHMEPDHSSSIEELRCRYPQIKIIGNCKTNSMLAGYYSVTDNLVEVKDGDVINIGENSLSFHMTPMVHWPETMMTYMPGCKLLFSGDAFGSFGALDGGIVDEEMDISYFWDEMYRYYSNIVGKYGPPVQKAMAKLSSLPIDMICSTHGPVWKKHLAEVTGIYDKMSRYEAEEGVVIAYGSMYGHTAAMANYIADALTEQGIKNIVVHDVSKSDVSFILRDIFKYKGLIIGSPTYSGELFPKVDSLVSQIALRCITDRVFGCFGSYSWAGISVKKLSEFSAKMKWSITGTPVEMKQAGTDADIPSECKALAAAIAAELKK